MGSVHFHLVFSHVVVVLTIVGTLLMVWALIRKSHEIRTAGLVISLAAGLIAIPVYLTGSSAEHKVEDLGVPHDAIEAHEESAEVTFVAIEILGVAALMALLLGMRQSVSGVGIATGVLLIGLVAMFLSIWTGMLGGKVRHGEEIGVRAASGAEDREEEEEEDEEKEEERDGY